MALERLLSFKERENMLSALLKLNESAEIAYNDAKKHNRPIEECYAAADAHLSEAKDLAAKLSWYPKVTITKDTVNGIMFFDLDTSAATVTARRTADAAAATNPFEMLASDDILYLRNAEDVLNRSRALVATPGDAILTFPSLQLTNSDDEDLEIELGWFEVTNH